MIQIHDITQPYPWPDALVKYFDAPIPGFDSSALEENWLQAKANALGCQMFKHILLPTGEYEVHMSAALYRVRQTQFSLFADHFELDIKHDFLLFSRLEPSGPEGIYRTPSGVCYFHMMDVADNIKMGTRSDKISRWIYDHVEWIYYYYHNMLYCQRNSKTKPMPVTQAYMIPDSTNNS